VQGFYVPVLYGGLCEHVPTQQNFSTRIFRAFCTSLHAALFGLKTLRFQFGLLGLFS